ncbi:MAG: Gfo/Idh/MocA family oxidoreductase, partial [Armatimonadetes bacterium]|nr:Gfo/Idh/MocA family oxidoreductase [Armatimonadota bacterium]
DRMIEAAEQSGVILMVAHNQRFLPVYQKAKEVIEDGKLGRIYLARADHNQSVRIGRDHWLWKKETAGGGAFIGSGIHRIDLLRWLVGEVLCVYHRQVLVPERFSDEVEAASVTVLEFDNGAIGELSCSWAAYGAAQAPWYELLLLYGTKGTLHNVGGLFIAVQDQQTKESFEAVPIPAGDSFVNEIRHFGECLIHHKEPLTSGREARKTLAVAVAAYESQMRNAPVAVHHPQ